MMNYNLLPNLFHGQNNLNESNISWLNDKGFVLQQITKSHFFLNKTMIFIN